MKKIFSFFMALVMIFLVGFSLTTPSFAVDEEVVTSYTVSIPSTVIPSDDSDTATEYLVSLENVKIENGLDLAVSVAYDGVLQNKSGVELGYSLYSGDTSVNNGDEILYTDGSSDSVSMAIKAVTNPVVYAGEYSDTITFDVYEREHYYTIEEIEESEYLYAIGKTDPSYVVARFNEDYTDVTIFKNGENSDGIMKDWVYTTIAENNSPMVYHKETLSNAKVKEGVTTIGNRAFHRCSNLTDIELPKGITKIGVGGFYEAGLTSLNLKEGLVYLEDYAFFCCKNIKGKVVVPEGVVSTGYSAFYGCESVEEFVLPQTLISTDYMSFINCSSAIFSTTNNYNVVDLPNLEVLGEYTFAHCKKLANVVFGNKLTVVSNYAFWDTALQEVIFPKSIKTISYGAFSNCGSLKKVIIEGDLSYIGPYAFRGCSLEDLISTGNITDLTIGREAFYRSGLTELVLPEGTTVLEDYSLSYNTFTKVVLPSTLRDIGENIFYWCSSLNEIVVAEENTLFKTVDGVLYSKDEKTMVAYPATKEGSEYSILSATETVKAGAFYGCEGLVTINLNENITDIGDNTFYHCDNLMNLSFPKNLKTIGDGAFLYCGNLKGLTLPSTVTSIGEQAFFDCDGLISVVLSTELLEIGAEAFQGCSWLSEVTIYEKVTSIPTDAFGGCPNLTTIKGISGSYAETWASENGYSFVAIEE